MKWLGIDVGGANIKLADGVQFAQLRPFPLWNRPDGLAEVLLELLTAAPAADGIAATMTGELCDCYETKADGVRHIVGALQEAAAGRPLAIYGVDGQFRPAEATMDRPLLAAASNWHALARFASRWLPSKTGILIDVGSTTTDIIPVVNGDIATSSKTDTDRLLAGELVYTGVARTPLAAIVDSVPYRGKQCPVAAELFATTADVYFLLESAPGAASSSVEGTADGREMTITNAVDRLARTICADRGEFNLEDAVALARHVRMKQISRLREALDLVTARHPGCAGAYLISGSGESLALDVAACEGSTTRCLSQWIGTAASGAAAAHGVATLASEELAGWNG